MSVIAKSAGALLLSACTPVAVLSVAFALVEYHAVSPQLYACIALDFAIQFAFYVHAAYAHTEKYYDISGTITFVAVIAASLFRLPMLVVPELMKALAPVTSILHRSKLPQSAFDLSAISTRQALCSAALLIWTLRLGTFLYARICRDKRDSRFDEVRDHWALFSPFFAIQSVWIAALSLPVMTLNSLPRDTVPLTARDYIGITLFIASLLFEAVADHQKTVFRQDESNKGKFITTGLWSQSRHPNYFGEIALHFCLWLVASTPMDFWTRIILLLGPCTNATLILFVSGVPPLEKKADEKWGRQKDYKEYKHRTPVLIPNPLLASGKQHKSL